MVEILHHPSEFNNSNQSERRWPVVQDGVMSVLRAAANAVYRWTQRARQRKHLAQLDDRLLKDVGITPLAAAEEAKKPFWK